MDWDSLRVFLAVARAGQFVAAAKQLKLDHATVGRRITALERALNARLFERRTTGVSLTAAGTKLLVSAERMESELLKVQAELTDADIELSGTVRIGAPDGLSTYYLARCFQSFARRYPAITIQLVPMPQAIPLAKREVDIVIVLEKPEAGRFITRKLTDYSLGIYGRRGLFHRSWDCRDARRSQPAQARRLCRGLRLFISAELCARSLWWGADVVRMRKRGRAVGGDPRRHRARRRP